MQYFPIKEAFEYGKSLSLDIKGRNIMAPADAGALAQMIVMAKHADHAEIGSLFGGSAIVAALAKVEFGLCGDIYCIDPLNIRDNPMPDAISGVLATKEVIMENAEKYGVENRIHVVAKPSDPFPLEKTFGTAYVDGDHWNDMPWTDWSNLRRRVSYMVMFDDYCYGKPEVVRACIMAASDPEWLPVYVANYSFIVRRRE